MNKAYYGTSSLSGRVGNKAGRVGFGDEFSCYPVDYLDLTIIFECMIVSIN